MKQAFISSAYYWIHFFIESVFHWIKFALKQVFYCINFWLRFLWIQIFIESNSIESIFIGSIFIESERSLWTKFHRVKFYYIILNFYYIELWLNQALIESKFWIKILLNQILVGSNFIGSNFNWINFLLGQPFLNQFSIESNVTLSQFFIVSTFIDSNYYCIIFHRNAKSHWFEFWCVKNHALTWFPGQNSIELIFLHLFFIIGSILCWVNFYIALNFMESNFYRIKSLFA